MTDKFDEDGDAYSPPPTEAEWEQFLKRSDARSAKYAELLETLIDHPDRDAIIDREMGWESDDGDGDSCSEAGDWTPDAIFDAAFEQQESAESFEELLDEDDDSFDFEESPVYHKAFAWSLHLHTELQKFFPHEGEMDPEDPLYVAFSECLIVPAKIAGSHAMSEDEESLGGCIVYNKRALKAAADTLAALEEMKQTGRFPAAQLDSWIAETNEVCEAVKQQIEEYRSRVWWD